MQPAGTHPFGIHILLGCSCCAKACRATCLVPSWLHRVELLWVFLQDMAPYVPKLMPKLKDALVDPLPEVRATAAKALGSLLKGMGEEYLQDILPYLMQKLKSEVGRCWTETVPVLPADVQGGNALLLVAGSIGTLTAAFPSVC